MSQVRKSRGGRPKSFGEETGRLNLNLPARLIRQIRLQALEQGRTPGEIVAELLHGRLGVGGANGGECFL